MKDKDGFEIGFNKKLWGELIDSAWDVYYTLENERFSSVSYYDWLRAIDDPFLCDIDSINLKKITKELLGREITYKDVWIENE